MARTVYTPVTDNFSLVEAKNINPVYTELAAVAISTPLASFKSAIEMLGTLALTDASEPLQVINRASAYNKVLMPSTSASNHPFYIHNITLPGGPYSADPTLLIRNSSDSTTLFTLQALDSVLMISDGSVWRATSSHHISSLLGLSIATPSVGDVIAWNGTEWAKSAGVSSGFYAPTIVGVSGVTSVSANTANWTKVGRIVSVSGMITIDAEAIGTQALSRISVPVATDFVGGDGGGIISSRDTTGNAYPDATNNAFYFDFLAKSTAPITMSYIYQYVGPV